MGVLEDLADELARDALDLATRNGDAKIVDEVSELVGSTSTTLQECYLTSVRIRRAAARGRDLLVRRSAGKPNPPKRPPNGE